MPEHADQYFNMSEGEGDARGSWNSDKNFEYITGEEKTMPADGGDGTAEVKLPQKQASVVEQMALRTASDPTLDPTTGADLGSGGEPET